MSSPSTVSPHELPPGTRIAGDFEILRTLAHGGMGIVYVALQHSTSKQRALKVMTPLPGALPSREGQAARRCFEQEAHVSARIQSDHVVQIIGAGVDASTSLPWIAMELLEGETLAERLTRGPLEWMDAWNVVGELSHALEAAHRIGVVHRDLKPTNVFLTRTWRPGRPRVVKVLDFGIARNTEDSGNTSGAIGTPEYMAPEQTAPGAAFVPGTDVWALGLLVFEMLTGSSYWRCARVPGAPFAAYLREIVLDPLVPASRRAHEIDAASRLPPGFDDWFARCVVRDPSRRFEDAGEAYRALARVLAAATGRTERGIPAPPFIGSRPPPPAPVKESLAPLAFAPRATDSTIDGLSGVAPPSRTAGRVFAGLVMAAIVLGVAGLSVLQRNPSRDAARVAAPATTTIVATEPAAPAPPEVVPLDAVADDDEETAAVPAQPSAAPAPAARTRAAAPAPRRATPRAVTRPAVPPPSANAPAADPAATEEPTLRDLPPDAEWPGPIHDAPVEPPPAAAPDVEPPPVPPSEPVEPAPADPPPPAPAPDPSPLERGL